MRARWFIAGALSGLVLVATAAFAVVILGGVDMAATSGVGLMDRFGVFALDRYLATRARNDASPSGGDTATAAAGLTAYAEMCVGCHGAPGARAAIWAGDMLPPPPALDDARVQARPDGALFLAIQRGIKMTGMPAFGPDHTDAQVWQLVAAVRLLPRLTAEQKALVGRAAATGAHQHEPSPAGNATTGDTPASPATNAATDHPPEPGHRHEH